MTRLPRPGIVVTEKPKDTLHPPSSFIRHDVPLICRFDQSVRLIKVNSDVTPGPGRCIRSGRVSISSHGALLCVVGVVGVEVQDDVVDAVDSPRLTCCLLLGTVWRWLEVWRLGGQHQPAGQVVRGLQGGLYVLVLVPPVLGGVGQLLGDVEVGGGGGGGGDVVVDVGPVVPGRLLLLLGCEGAGSGGEGEGGGGPVLALLPHSHLQQVEQFLRPPTLEGEHSRTDRLPPSLETEQPVLLTV